MIVIAIIAILAAILVPNMLRARERAKLSSCEENLRTVLTASSMYRQDNEGFPPVYGILDGTHPLEVHKYIKHVECPNKGTYRHQTLSIEGWTGHTSADQVLASDKTAVSCGMDQGGGATAHAAIVGNLYGPERSESRGLVEAQPEVSDRF